MDLTHIESKLGELLRHTNNLVLIQGELIDRWVIRLEWLDVFVWKTSWLLSLASCKQQNLRDGNGLGPVLHGIHICMLCQAYSRARGESHGQENN